jgi:hypothetical protein
MILPRHGAFSRGAHLLVAALLLVPLLLSGHQHHPAQRVTSSPCATCVLTHFSPTATAPVTPQVAPRVEIIAVAFEGFVAQVHAYRSPKAGRAPPPSSSTQLV